MSYTDNSELLIYRASAGSGKTHTIAKQFLKLTLLDSNPLSFSKILAVTFTNKAVEEMKLRLIDALNDVIANGLQTSYIQGAKEFEKISDQELKQRALLVRSQILHSYSYFSISTIDSFNQRIVRAFSHDLHLPASYDIQLDTDLVKTQIYQLFIEDISLSENTESQEILKWLENFIRDKVEDTKSWNIKDEIIKITDVLFKDEFILLTTSNKNIYNRKKLQEIEKIASQIIEDYKEGARKFQEEFEEIDKDLNNTQGIKTYRSAYNAIKTFLDNGDYVLKALGSTAQKFIFSNGKLLTAAALKDKGAQDFVQRYSQKIKDLVYEALEFGKKNFRKYYTAKAIKEVIYLMGIFDDLLKQLEVYRRRNNELLISDITIFLRKIIAESETPFIYEKIGQRYENLLIDEFQDTSRFQWDNFRPLVKESLANGHSSMIVGDVKQAIYRWRGGDWRLLLEEIENEFKGYVRDITEGQKSTNWRSAVNIIQFNNKIFSVLPQLLQDSFEADIISKLAFKLEDLEPESQEYKTTQDILEFIDKIKNTITRAYSEVEQNIAQPNQNYFGKVEIHLFRKQNDIKTKLLQQLIETIKELISEGYNYSDIAILVRRTEEVKLVAQALIEFRSQNPNYDFTVLSNESLLLKFSPAINLIINFLNYIAYEDSYYLKLVTLFYNRLKNSDIDFTQILLAENQDDLKAFLPDNFDELLENINKKTLFDTLQQLIKYFDLDKNKDQYPFLRSFEDIIVDFMYANGSDLKLFLDYWEQKQDKFAINVSESKSAIRILTIHRAKGLAFPIVIVPFASWQLQPTGITRNIVWSQAESKEFKTIASYPLYYKTDLLNSEFAKAYIEENLYNYMDNLNILYVALTRARERMIIFSIFPTTTKNNVFSNIGFAISRALPMIADPEINEKDYQLYTFDKKWDIKNSRFANKHTSQAQNIISIDKYRVNSWMDKTDIELNSTNFFVPQELKDATTRGILLHKIMSYMHTLDDLPQAVNQLANEGLVPANQKEAYALIVENMIKKAGKEDWFSKNWEVLNEENILLKDVGKELRPDRIIRNKDKIIIIDFKFAKPNKEHIKQVRQYVDILQEMYPGKTVEGYLLYENGTLKQV